jgi:hypothetical protein
MDRMHHNFAYTRLLTRVLRFGASELRVLRRVMPAINAWDPVARNR